MPFFQLSTDPLDMAQLRRGLQRPDAGAIGVFEGWVRDHHLGKDVTSLTYEAYAPLALTQGEAICAQALERFDLLNVSAAHRTGDLLPGQLAVWVGVSARHRDEAFKASRWIIDSIKSAVPIWKHEFYTDGTQDWVDPTACSCAEHHVHHDEHAHG